MHSVREQVAHIVIHLQHIFGTDQVVNIFTKPLRTPKFITL